MDRGNGRVIALLDDGSVDSAPNLIAPDLRLPDTIHSVLREDWKFFAAITRSPSILGGLYFGTSAALAGTWAGSPEMVADADGLLRVRVLTAAACGRGLWLAR